MRKLPLVTPRATVDIRGVYGQSVLDLHDQMRRLLVQHTGDESIGNLFAEPQLNPVRGEIAWYTHAAGPIVPVTALMPEAQVALWRQLDILREQVKAAGERYIASGGQTAGTRTDTFHAMLTVTDLSRCLFSVGGHPVLSEWGCSLVAGATRSVDLWIAGAARPLAPLLPEAVTVPPPEPLPRSGPPSPLPEDQPLPFLPSHATVDVPTVETITSASISHRTPVRPRPPSSTEPAPRPSVAPLHSEPTGAGSAWHLLKYLILLLLAFLLLGFLLRACSALPILDTSAANEEKQLRAEIKSLREQAGQIAARCTPAGSTP